MENGNGSGNALPEFVLVMLRFDGKAKGSAGCRGQGEEGYASVSSVASLKLTWKIEPELCRL